MSKKDKIADENATEAQAVQVPAKEPETIWVPFEELLNFTGQDDFDQAVAGKVPTTEFPEVAEIQTGTEAKRAVNNAALCFRENRQRFQAEEVTYKVVQEKLASDPQNVEALKELEQSKRSLQKFANKMAIYSSKVAAAKERFVQVATPEELAPKKRGPKAAEGIAEAPAEA